MPGVASAEQSYPPNFGCRTCNVYLGNAGTTFMYCVEGAQGGHPHGNYVCVACFDHADAAGTRQSALRRVRQPLSVSVPFLCLVSVPL